MGTYHLTQYRLSLAPGESTTLGPGHHALFAFSGSLQLNGEALGGYAAGGSEILNPGTEEVTAAQFVLGSDPAGKDPVCTAEFALDDGPHLFRLDQVSFPLGGVAYRHHHSGPGIRHLIRGQLTVASDHGEKPITVGQSWFEATHDPVIATASDTEETAFIRASVLPTEFLGRSSITYLNPEDADKPKLQTYKRFFEEVITLTD